MKDPDFATKEKYTIETLLTLPPESGVYIVKSGDKVLYVGKAVNINSRWNRGHHRLTQLLSYPNLEWVCYLMPKSKIDKAERRMITRYNPLLNGTRTKSVGKRFELTLDDVKILEEISGTCRQKAQG